MDREDVHYRVQSIHIEDADRATNSDHLWSDQVGRHRTAAEAWKAMDETRKVRTRMYRVIRREVRETTIDRDGEAR